MEVGLVKDIAISRLVLLLGSNNQYFLFANRGFIQVDYCWRVFWLFIELNFKSIPFTFTQFPHQPPHYHYNIHFPLQLFSIPLSLLFYSTIIFKVCSVQYCSFKYENLCSFSTPLSAWEIPSPLTHPCGKLTNMSLGLSLIRTPVSRRLPQRHPGGHHQLQGLIAVVRLDTTAR